MTQKKWWQRLLPHGIALLIFLLIAVVYCTPAFQHKVLVQEDMTQWRAMSHGSFQYKQQHGHFPLWTPTMFSGMPGYLIAMETKAFGPQYYAFQLLTLGLPTPASFFFLACVSIYFLTQVLRVNPYVGVISGLAYAYATYNPVIISVGHETKMQTIALLPAFIAGLMLIYEKKYVCGAAMAALCTAMIVAANHMQIFYYGLIIAGGMTAGYVVRWIIKKDWRHLIISAALASLCCLIGILCNSVLIFTTSDISEASIRGGSELAGNLSAKGGLSEDYAFSYSLYPTETFILMVPKMYGGSSGPELTARDSKAIASLEAQPPDVAKDIRQQDLLTFYWGGIGGTAGPAYAGAVICLLALLGMFVLDHAHKWWIAATALLAVLMSWGGYFAEFNRLLLQYLPFYNKFRAPSVILVIPVFLMTVLAALTLNHILTSPDEKVKKRYYQGLLMTAGILLIVLWLYFRLDYTTWYDRQFLRHAAEVDSTTGKHMLSFLQALKDDRKTLFLYSLIRTFLFMAAAALAAGLYIKHRISRPVLLIAIGALAFSDVIGIDVQYLNNDNYKPAADKPGDQVATAADKFILRDTGYYRVFDRRYSLTYGAPTAWFHHSIGGYHAAKLSIYQDLIGHQLENYPRCQPVINMLNTRYIIEPDNTVIRNDSACGPIWFVQGVKYYNSPEDVMAALTDLDAKDTAALLRADSHRVIFDDIGGRSDKIWLTQNDNDEMIYRSSTEHRRFAVFSEVWYKKGWKAFIDGVETPIIRTNYALRGISVPAGRHTIRLVFHPRSYYLGESIQWVTGILTLLLLLISLISGIYAKNKHPARPLV
ncbi:MAG: YfhO family protein [Chitinophagaceae bacterium]|nr:YfhO family protein [Chitinophagaceae bacterium]